ncbi:hypothetical protein HBH64_058500 [Parastagonospora nodorum]|nr:hypothetical protein HBH49_045510 [Parastagonospora nodorum]KAH4110593.1 hypothetical protein HBH46_015220 [Parastagonospora nodorum]KAH4169305.1 hypothetical protein HBH43_115560 [Parastagonospora nodorum]KAH4197844.1 hypothetical protein HBH42_062710 [Parastagonospora nodorum]KAH4311088.1 hypothetical protein HBI01_013300 [Parastagonospora nodorum]
MEPPAKRLRILQSVDVDETNPDYIIAKQKQQQKFKGTLESIFAKYENMHESMSDEIDLHQGKMVVDRGHLRRLARQAHREETMLLNSLALGTGPEPEEESEKEGKEEDSEDELAPTQPVVSRSVQKDNKRRRSTALDEAHSLSSNTVEPQAHTKTSASTPIAQTGVQPAPQTPNPITNLLQFVQFPQTPAGQQARSSFYTTLTQTINYAVQQTVAPLFSGALPSTPNVQLPFLNALPLQTTPIPSADNVAPARDPKWFFPPLSNELPMADLVQSSPIPAPATSATALEESTQEEPCIPESDPQPEPSTDDDMRMGTISTAAMVQAEETADMGSKKAARRTSPRVEIQRRPGRLPNKYVFTEEDDVYLYKRKVLHNRTYTEIRDSKEKWKNWPLWTFQNRWHKHLKERNLHAKGHSAFEVKQDDKTKYDNETIAVTLHHLPTPSSSGLEDDNTPVLNRAEDSIADAVSSSVPFDDDERELLSLAGADLSEEQLLLETEEEPFFPDADETVLPSVEQEEFVDEDLLQQGLLEDSASEEIKVTTPSKIKSEVQQSPPTSTRRRTRAAIVHHTVPDTEADSSFQNGNNSVSQENILSVCDFCHATFNTFRGLRVHLRVHQANSPSTHEKARPKSPSIDLVGDDELQADVPSTPKIKREFSTPPPTSFLFSTPAAQSQSRPDATSSDVKSASGLNRRAYLKQVKQSWTKKSSPAPKTLSKRKSFHTLPRKRDWVEVAESDDELAF